MTWFHLTYYFLISSNLFSNIFLIYLCFNPIENKQFIQDEKTEVQQENMKIKLSLKNIECEIAKIKSQIQSLENPTTKVNMNTNYFK